MNKKKKNIVVQAFLDKNIGDDLMIDILSKNFPEYDFYLWGLNENEYPAFKDLKNIHGIDKYKILKNLFKIDAFLIIGGSIFHERIGKYFNYHRRNLLIYIMKLLGKKVLVLNCNIGPIKTEKGLRIFKKTFNNSDAITVRDKKSYRILEKLNVKSDFYLGSDYIFQYEDKDIIVEKKNDFFTLGISVWNHKRIENKRDAYIQMLSSVIRRCSKSIENCKIILFGFNSGLQNDELIINKVMKNVRNSEININKVIYNDDINLFLRKFRKSDFIIGTRFHSIILSLKYEIPFLPVIYSIKTENLLNDISYHGFKINFSSINNIKISEIMDSINRKKREECDLKTYGSKSKIHNNILKKYLDK